VINDQPPHGVQFFEKLLNMPGDPEAFAAAAPRCPVFRLDSLPQSQHAESACVTTGGVHLCSDRPFNLSDDATFRIIPRSARAQDLAQALQTEH
jgi:hypothetical protein